VKIVERLTKGESEKKIKNKSHEASYIVVEVGGTSTFVTHDVTKVEVRWAETHLKLKSHAPKERGRLTPRKSARLSAVWDRASPCGPGPSRWGPRVPPPGRPAGFCITHPLAGPGGSAGSSRTHPLAGPAVGQTRFFL
jgi:hypothetical protein